MRAVDLPMIALAFLLVVGGWVGVIVAIGVLVGEVLVRVFPHGPRRCAGTSARKPGDRS